MKGEESERRKKWKNGGERRETRGKEEWGKKNGMLKKDS